MGNWIGGAPRKTPKEMMEMCQDDLGVAKRQMQRSIQDLEREDRKLLVDAKRAQSEGKTAQAKQHAHQIIRYRGAIVRMSAMMGRMTEITINIKLMQSTHEMQRAMVGVTRAMAKINRRFNIPKMAQIMNIFEKETYKMDMSQDMMNDAMDTSMAQYDDDGAENELLQQVMDEIGIDISERLSDVPLQPVTTSDAANDEILSRLDRLRGPGE